jgi:two-component system, chemotaxis family, chemotaxis protein CheY
VSDTPIRVLVVEDDDAIALVLEDLLVSEGFLVARAADGSIALHMLVSFAPHVILLDLMMPVMDGWAFRRHQLSMGAALAAIPVVVLSGAREATTTAAELDPAAVVVKPFVLDALIEAIRGVVQA